MERNIQTIVQKLWNLKDIVRDDAITVAQYVIALNLVLFVKVAQEVGAEDRIPTGMR